MPTFSNVVETKHVVNEPNSAIREIAYFNFGTLRSTANFALALSNVINVKISDLLAFLLMLLFSSLCYYPEIDCSGGAHFHKVARL